MKRWGKKKCGEIGKRESDLLNERVCGVVFCCRFNLREEQKKREMCPCVGEKGLKSVT
jgi:hypothetical protein